jgi:oligosaccharide repeat unit polymerase
VTEHRRLVPGLQPLVLIVLCWGLTLAVLAWVLGRMEQLDLVQSFMRREGISASVFTREGLVWILVGLFAFAVGDLAARITRRVRGPDNTPELKHNRAARMAWRANLVLLGVTALWIVTSASKAGGLVQLAAAAYVDSLTTRDLLLENKLFVGMRLFYAALPATASMAAALIATGKLAPSHQRLMWALLAINTAALLILPLVMSQRLLLLQLLLSAYFAACLIRGRIFGLGWGVLICALFFALWCGREALTNFSVERSTFDIATQKLAYYVVNDMFNAFAPHTVPIRETNGGLLLEGVMFVTFTDGYFLSHLKPRLEALDPVIGGGEFPFFTAAYVDFGAKGGAIFILLTGFVLRRIYARAASHFGWALIYAQIAAALMFSSHSVYFTHQNFYFSAALLGLLVALSSVKRLPEPCRTRDPRPQPVRRINPVFQSRRAPQALPVFASRRMSRAVAHA